MRAWLVPLLLAALLAGCSGSHAPAKDEGLPPLPPPRNVHPNDLIGLDAVDDLTGRVPVSPWAKECVRQWTSGAYTYETPPFVMDRPCLFYPTTNGTLFWHLIDNHGDIRFGVPAAPIPRSDGFFDWFVFDEQDYLGAGGRVFYFENGSLQPSASWDDFAVDAQDSPSAVRLADGSSHFIVRGRGPIHHYWLDAEGATGHETIVGGNGFSDYTLRSGNMEAYALGTLAPGQSVDAPVLGQAYLGANPGAETVFVTSGGQFQPLPPATGNIFDVARDDSDVLHACVGSGPAYLHAWMDRSAEALPLWQYEVIAASPLAQLAFSCDITTSPFGVTVVIDSPALIGGGPNPTGGSHAYTRNADGTWIDAPIGFTFHSGDDLATVNGTPYHDGATGSGTTNNEPKCGFELRRPHDLDPRGPWDMVFCNNEGDWSYLLDSPTGGPLVVASGMLNPPFNDWGSGDDDAVKTTAVVLALRPGI